MKQLNLWKKNKRIFGCIVTLSLLMMGITACGSSADGAQASVRQTGQADYAEGKSIQAEDTPDETETGSSSASEESAGAAESKSTSGEDTPVFGQITAIEGEQITIALVQQPAPFDRESFPEGGEIPKGESGPDLAARPDGEAPSGIDGNGQERKAGQGEKKDRAVDGSSKAELASGQPDDAPGSAFSGEADGDGRQMEGKLTGETMDIQVTEETVITINEVAAALEDLSVGDTVTVIKENDIVTMIAVGQPGGGPQPPSAN